MSIQYRFSPYVIRPADKDDRSFPGLKYFTPLLDFFIGEEYLGTLCQEFEERAFEKEPVYGTFCFCVRGETSLNRYRSRNLIGYPGTIFRNMCDDIIRRFDFESGDISEGVEILRNASIWYSEGVKSLMIRLP